MRTFITNHKAAIRDYLLTALFMLPLLIICYAVLETSAYHTGTAEQARIVKTRQAVIRDRLQPIVGLGWAARNWSFVVIAALAFIELVRRDKVRSLLRRATLVCCTLAVSTYTVVVTCSLLVTMAVDFRLLHQVQNG